jgi:2-polyprenyl-3-methyl-5-hydroxy-6-metoxy-1,4-benzoquinol methylase
MSDQAECLANCRVCGATTTEVGMVHGSYSGRDYQLVRCDTCRFAFIADPWTEFDRIYDERYYAGQGADPFVDYHFELTHPEDTIRVYEWDGVTRVVSELRGGVDGVRWLDFGCGNGGLVRHVRDNTGADIVGYDQGAITAEAISCGIPILSAEELDSLHGSFDVLTAIEVIEHTLDPVAELRRMRELLKPGGLLFLTTGNAAPHADSLTQWNYVIPEIHIGFFEPMTLEYALREAGFRPEFRQQLPGREAIVKFKVLKTLHIKRRNLLTDAIPARPLAAVVDHRAQVSRHPFGWAEK